MIYRLRSEKIVFQEGIDSTQSDNICSRGAGALAKVIADNFGEPGVAMCCRSDACNKDVPADFASGNDGRFLFLEDFRKASGTAGDGGEGTNRASSTMSFATVISAAMALALALMLR